jgi:hypothetical protein
MSPYKANNNRFSHSLKQFSNTLIDRKIQAAFYSQSLTHPKAKIRAHNVRQLKHHPNKKKRAFSPLHTFSIFSHSVFSRRSQATDMLHFRPLNFEKKKIKSKVH